MAAAAAADSVPREPGKVVIKTEPEDGDGFLPTPRDVPVKRDPVVSLLSPVSGVQPLSWSPDHRLAVCTSSSLSVMELICDVHNGKQDLNFYRTSIPVPTDIHRLQVGPSDELMPALEKFSLDPDPTIKQAFLANTVINPNVGEHKGVKYASWSPLGCDSIGRCLLAYLTLDNRLTVHSSHRHLSWNTLTNLTEKYSERLRERGYATKDNKPPEANLLDFSELQRRFQMQTPLRMEWSSIYTIKKVLADNSCVEEQMVLLAVLMENGDLVLWKFMLPFAKGDDVVFYDLIESGVSRPSDLAWWEYENGGQRMGGLIVGSEAGPIKIMPVSLSKVKGYFTIRHPIILWKECDEIPVENLRCFPLFHRIQKSSCSLIVASRGCYLFWCLLTISAKGLSVHNSHITGLHSLPLVSLVVIQHPVEVYTCSIDGWIKKLVPTFTENSLVFKVEDLFQPEALTHKWIHGMAVSHNGAYVALVTTQGIVDGFHPVTRNHQVHFLALKSPETAISLLLKSPEQNLYNLADLLDLVRWQVFKTKRIPAWLQDELDRKIQEADSPFWWRIKLFVARVVRLSLQPPRTEINWKPKRTETKVFLQDEEMDEADVGMDNDAAQWTEGESDLEKQEARRTEAQKLIDAAETHLMRENMKKVLGVVYLNTWMPENFCIPTCGLMDYLSRDPGDKDSEVLIGHIRKKLNKQTFPEHCSLCQATLPFTDYKQAVCENGHAWLRCVLSYQACQTLTFRRCLLQDCIARLPEPEDPDWIKKLMKAPCVLCDSPMI
ncbi:general transcription factor 3C polypeptide 4 [Cyprinodon tularosa]|uniref:general transcription factor 3C polypeptide 4 n=1 Tax=Cyprinodon tularosa TaxID=77115 RepID=UPI0018E2516D|nr:general transcription factor 3C polypeptide 4 [Cyprinodon tularosa]